MELFFVFIIAVLPVLLSSIEFIGFLIKGERVVNIYIFRMIEIASFLILPYLYISLDSKNDCCSDSAAFSPDHKLTILVIVVLCTVAYFYSSYRAKIATPIIEVIVNCLLTMALILNIF